jgi:hypothetical protein
LWFAGSAAAVIVGVGAIGAVTQGAFDEELGVEVGDCIPEVPDEATDALDTVACREPHDAEVFAIVRDETDDAETYPGVVAMMRRAVQGCVDAFPGYTGTTLSRAGLDVIGIWPSEATWGDEGDRTTICLLRAVDGDLVGSRKGSSSDRPLPAERSLVTLTVGDCFSSDQLSAGQGTAAVELVDCADPHTFEVFATTEAADGVEHDEVDDVTGRTCLELLEGYVGVPYHSSVLDVVWISPRSDHWDMGDRRSFCLATNRSSDLVGSVRNTKR